MYYPVETRIAPLATIRRERLLPVRGQVLVSPGETIGPSEPVARCLLPGEVQAVDVSRALGVRREMAFKYLRKTAGETVQAGEILAAHSGLMGRFRPACRAPLSGEITTVRNGLVLIEAAAITFELHAHIPGRVTNVMPKLGAVISATGAIIQGVWGSGGETEGVLKVVADSPEEALGAGSIDISCHGALVVGGHISDEKVLEEAVQAKVRGIIAGSAEADMRPRLQALPFPVLITEGFGGMPMSRQAFALLHANMGREAMLSADIQTRWGTRRPEVFIPLHSDEAPASEDPEILPLKVGVQVRVLRAPHLGVVGTVSELLTLPQLVESGARLPVASVDLAGVGPALVPLANLELIR
jgi:hypothetical protein